MARAPREQKALRRQTAEFIASDPTAVVLSRATRQPDGAGGWTPGEPAPLAPQVVKFQPLGRFGAPERSSPAGDVYVPTHVLVGMDDLDAKAADTLRWNGDAWRVVFVDDTLGYRTTAEVMRSGD